MFELVLAFFGYKNKDTIHKKTIYTSGGAIMADKRNATASWSGYLHQGKVGIMLALLQIKDLLTEGNEFMEWSLEYESAEDIDIKSNVKVISRHQVKAYKSAKYPNDYVDVLNEQKYKFEKNTLTLEQKGFQIYKFDDRGNIINLEVDENSRFLHTVTKTEGFGLSETIFTNRYPKTKYTPNPNKIQLYTYPDKRQYCELSTESDEDQIKKFCIAEIEEILKLENHDYKDDSNRHECIYYWLLDVLDSKIRIEHKNGGYPKITFDEILNILVDITKIEEKNISFMRRFFIEKWFIFLNEIQEKDSENIEKQVQTEEVIKMIYDLDDREFVQFFRNINPDKVNDHESITESEIYELCKSDSIKDIFYEVLLKVKNKEFNIGFVGYEENGGYLLTIINRRPARIKAVISDIFSNKKLTKEIFQRKYLINDRINGIKIGDKIDQLEGTSSNNWNRTVTSEDIFYLSNMTFIDVDNAIIKLNSEDEE